MQRKPGMNHLVSSLFLLLWVAVPVGTTQAASIQENGRYVNEVGSHKMKIAKGIAATVRATGAEKSPKQTLPIQRLDAVMLREAEGPLVYRLGHSSMLIKLGQDLVLVDPVFSERASPLQWIGPRRFHPVPLAPEELPVIKAVIISHDHYDHLDKNTVRQLAPLVEYFVTPLGVGEHLRTWGIDPEAVIELDWWDSVELDELTLVATPAQHFSGRGITDRNKTLWASWVIQGHGANLFFSGDTGYFDGFKEIGERYGPFDVTMIENGAYNLAWRSVHMMPEESVQAHLDLRGKAMLPIHNSTFDLSTHAWYEPMERVSALAAENGVELLTPVIGAPLHVLAPQPTYAWWRNLTAELIADSAGGEEACAEIC